MNKPDICTYWQHNNGNVYIVVEIANEHSTRLEEYPVTVVYRGVNGKTWSRPLSQWSRSMTQISHSEYDQIRMKLP